MSCIWAVEKFIWKYQDSSVSNGFLTECCVPWDANEFYAKTDPAYRVSPPLHNNFLSISVKRKSCFPKWWMHNNIYKPPVARSATTTDVENPFHTHLNSTSKFWTVPYGSKIHEFMLEKFKIYQGRVFQDIREHFCSIRKEFEGILERYFRCLRDICG